MRKHNKRVPMIDRVIGFLNGLLLTVMLLCFCVPLLNVLSNSFSPSSDVLNGKVWLVPHSINLDGYKRVFEVREIWIGYMNSIIIAASGCILSLIMTVLVAYPLSKKTLPGRAFFIVLYTIPMFFGGGLIPGYILRKNLGLLNTFWAIILPAISPTYVIIIRTFFVSSIPSELYEAAELDGANEAYTLIRIVIPLSTAVLAVYALTVIVGHWNSYFSEMIYLTDPDKINLQMVLKQYVLSSKEIDEMLEGASGDTLTRLLKEQAEREVIKYCIIVVAMLPMIIIYPFVQKYFVKGVMIGSIKG